MQSLFIIGNGFDCYGHGMSTRYADFKQYLTLKYPDYEEDYDGILEFTVMPDGSEVYDMNEVVGSIIRIIDECSEPGWGNLESCLGKEYVDSIAYDNEWAFKIPQFEEDDDEIFHSIYENEDVSNSVIGAYQILKELFNNWVFDSLGEIDYAKVVKLKKKPSFKKSLFLNFNYTKTIQELYNVNDNQVCHIHGDATDSNGEIYFGHGNDEEIDNLVRYIGIDDAFTNFKQGFRKNTKEAIRKHIQFFKRLGSVNKIYSYGFSFSDVDMIYITEICKNLVPQKTRWYFNEYDWKFNKKYVEVVKELGFKVRRCQRW